jgi:hypothetical protein
MIVTVHQPHFMPWLGYLHRMARADLFVLLDHVQFERRGYQNRTQIRMNGEARWLTVPVAQRSREERIVDKVIDNGLHGTPRWWSAIHFQTLRHAYREAPFLREYAPALREIFETRWARLVDLDDALLGLLRDALGIRTPMVRSSELRTEGAKSELILNLCREVGADALLVGLGGSRRYLDAARFEREGIRLVFQEFTHPVYPQCGAPATSAFTAGLSAIDLLLNRGPAAAREMLCGEARTDASLVAA